MSIDSFEARVAQAKFLGLPANVFYFSLLALMLTAVAIIFPFIVIKFVFLFVAVAVLFLAYQEWIARHDWLVLAAKQRGNDMFKVKTFSSSQAKTYANCHTWYTRVGQHGIAHKDAAVSIAFSWDGERNRFFDEPDFLNSHKAKVATLKIASLPNVCIENHWDRRHCEKRIDEYLAYQRKVNPDAPKIVSQITSELAEMYRPLARVNRTFTIITVKKPNKSIWSTLRKRDGNLTDWQDLEKSCLQLFQSMQSEYSGAQLLSAEEFIQEIQNIRSPYEPTFDMDWRFDLSEQLITEKPTLEDNCLKLGKRYFKVCVFQNYPILSINWFLGLAEVNCDVHISQIIQPKDVERVLDQSKKAEADDIAVSSNKRGVDLLAAKISNNRRYRQHIAVNALPVADNAYIVTFSGLDKSHISGVADKLKKMALKQGGLVRSDNDVQLAMFQYRLPGEGINTPFKREDHGDVIAAMMPNTVFSKGSAIPEILRMGHAGNIITFSPSTLEVPHEMVVSNTGGGKDTQFGLKIIESYKTTRYDIVELGNSYQGVIEAVGGRYCRAKEQIINPLASYAEFEAIRTDSALNNNNLYRNALNTQADILVPVFKGFGENKFSRPEEVVIGNVLEWLYAHPTRAEAPVLPDLLPCFKKITITSDAQRIAAQELSDQLYEFLQTQTGKGFIQQNQYTISPVANAIDFLGLDGEMFNFTLTFCCTRLANNAMTSGRRGQIVLNEYKVLLEMAPHVVRHITWTIDRMGRKDWVGLTRISQGIAEIQSVDTEAIDSISNVTLLSRKTQHDQIGALLQVPISATAEWRAFESPDELIDKKRNYREALVLESGQWHKLLLRFPKLLLDLMNTRGEDKEIRYLAYARESDPFKRIALLNKLKNERDEKKNEPTETTSRSTVQPAVNDVLL